MEEQLKPTIENPFEKKHKSNSPPLLRRQPEPPKVYQPPYYVSQATLNFLTKQIESATLTADELPTVHKIALIVGKALGRATPTLSDVQIAAQFRTLEHIQKISTGEESFDIMRHMPNQEMMPKQARLNFWKMLAQRVIDDYETT